MFIGVENDAYIELKVLGFAVPVTHLPCYCLHLSCGT